jgi:hypothetical protein
MSGEQRRSGAPRGAPWSLDLLADLHAGLPDQGTADDLQRQAHDDPEASEILAALDATTTELADLPSLTMPEDVASRIAAALPAESRTGSQAGTTPAAGHVVTLEAAGRRRRVGWSMALLSAAAAILAAVVIASTTLNTTGTDQAAGPSEIPESPPPLVLQGSQVRLDQAQFTEVLRSHQYSSMLSDPAKLGSCLQANGIPNGRPIAAREVTLNGRPAQLLILSAGTIGRFRLLAVDPSCGPGNPATVSDSAFGE